MVILEDKNSFPDPSHSDPDGLVALGGDLSPERLLQAYKKGIFPWETHPIIAWYSPDPRCVLFPSDVVISSSMKNIMRKKKFSFQLNNSFSEVMEACMSVARHGVQGSWISPEMIDSFKILHEKGFAYSAETWINGQLAGGLYGLIIGKIFFGESMFSFEPNASKFALINFCKYLEGIDVKLIDCQVHSDHLQSMGATLIPRNEFLNQLKVYIG